MTPPAADPGGNTHTVGRVRIRPGGGPRAATTGRRLARIASEHLGTALDRALADVTTDVYVDDVTVRFPADVDELDDAAVALLWASLVRASVERELSGVTRAPGRDVADDVGGSAPVVGPSRPPGPPDETTDGAPVASLTRALERWVRHGIAPADPQLRVLRSRPDLAETAISALAPAQRAEAGRLLAPRAVPPAARPPKTATDAPATPPAPSDRRDDGPPSPSPAVRPHRRSSGATAEDRPRGDIRDQAAQDTADRVAVSAWGGLVLLHYRLRAYLEEALAEDAPDGVPTEPAVVRAAALALVVDDPAAVGDPLVRLLAGHREWAAPDDRPTPVAPATPAATERATRLLRDFAGDLRGFAGSSPGFVRDQWLRRRALLLEDPPAVVLTLERRPLDLVVDRLPYPVGALRLPWTPPLFTGWERS